MIQKKKKILAIITTGFVPFGGLTTVMMNYYRQFDCLEFIIDFASTNDPVPSLVSEIEQKGSQYFQLPSRKTRTLLYFNSLVRLCKGYDVVHIHGNSSTTIIELLAARIAGVKKRIVHNHTSKCDHRMLNSILHPFFSVLYTDGFACSKKAGEWLFTDGRFGIIRNAINVDRFILSQDVRQQVRSEFGFGEDEFVIGHVGKIYKPKNHHFIVDVFKAFLKIYPNSRLLLVGGGEMEEEIGQYIADNDISDKVVITGVRTDIPEMLNAMDLFLFPSLWEGLPLSVLEAQASGLPVVLSDTISDEVHVSDQCFALPLENSADKWAEFIVNHMHYDRSLLRESNVALLAEHGYDIRLEAKRLKDIYLS